MTTTTDRKRVNVNGLLWVIASKNERYTSLGGRHFFALRCNTKQQWSIIELNRDLGSGSAREIGYLPHQVETKHLSLAVLFTVSTGPDLPTRSMDTPLNTVTKPADTEFLRLIGATEFESL